MHIFLGMISLGDHGQVPEWVHLLPLGRVNLVDQREPFQVDRESLELMVRAFRSRGLDLVVDYEHQSLSGDRAPAAGWIKALEARADGLHARVEWTEAARNYLAAREYRYFSPVLRLDPETRRPVALLQVALTNVPAINGLKPLVAKAADETIKQEGAKAMIEKLKKLLGITGEQGEVEILALVEGRMQEVVALKAQAAALPEIAQVLALKADAGVSEILGTIRGLQDGRGRLAAVEGELTALKSRLTEQDALAAVEEALAAGKLTPAEKDLALEDARRDVAAFKARMAVRPQVVPLGQRYKPPQGGGTGQEGLDSEQAAMCANAGIKPEAFKDSRNQLIEQGLLKDGR